MYRECYLNQKVTFDKRSHKRLKLHIPNAKTNCIPYPLLSARMGEVYILRSRQSVTTLRLCTEKEPTSVGDKLRLVRLSARKLQTELAEHLGIDRSTYLRYENGQVSEHNMDIEILKETAIFCGKPYDCCFNAYHAFLDRGVGNQLKEYRKQTGLTQAKLAERLGVYPTTVKRWESGEARPNPEYIAWLLSLNGRNGNHQ